MEVVYSPRPVPNAGSRIVKNPSMFRAVETGATKVFIANNWPDVIAAYERAGVTVVDIATLDASAPDTPAPKRSAHRRKAKS